MEISYRLSLPREEATVPVVRHLCLHTLKELGVAEDCWRDICGALSEACANVLHHAHGPDEDEYAVEIEVDDSRCIIRVIDSGAGFDPSRPVNQVDPVAERGRGISLMRALADDVRFESKPEAGTIVHLEKKLEFRPDAPIVAIDSLSNRRVVG